MLAPLGTDGAVPLDVERNASGAGTGTRRHCRHADRHRIPEPVNRALCCGDGPRSRGRRVRGGRGRRGRKERERSRQGQPAPQLCVLGRAHLAPGPHRVQLLALHASVGGRPPPLEATGHLPMGPHLPVCRSPCTHAVRHRNEWSSGCRRPYRSRAQKTKTVEDCRRQGRPACAGFGSTWRKGTW